MDETCENTSNFKKFCKRAFVRAERKERGDKKAKLFQNITLKALKYQYLLIALACIRIILILMN